MKKLIVLLTLALLTLPIRGYSDNHMGSTSGSKYEMGINTEMPFTVLLDGESESERGGTLVGVHGHYYVQPNWSVGLKFDFGVEDKGFADNPLYLSPGTTYYFMPDNSWNPYFRADIPLLLNNDFDGGVSGGLGLRWNLADLTGVDGLGLKYDTSLTYFFDAAALNWNIFRFALVYNW